MAIIGYMEGTDPNLLSKLCTQGHTTLPVGNGTDGYGKCVTYLTAADRFSMLIAHLHKLVPISWMTHLSIEDRLFACKTHHIPIILVIPEESKNQAEERSIGLLNNGCLNWTILFKSLRLAN